MMNLENLSVVFDTNIFISSVVFGGKPSEVYTMALNGKFTLITSPMIMQETQDCLIAKFSWSIEKAQDFTNQIIRIARMANVENSVQGVCRDPKDEHVLSLAATVAADYIISGDKDLLILKKFHNIKIVDTSTFLKLNFS